jgi:hypothetical protein
MTIPRVMPALAVLTLILTTAFAQNAVQKEKEAEKKEAERKAAERDQPERCSAALPTLKVYEWGVATMNWDGSVEPPDDVPAAYYEASEVPLEQAPARDPLPQPGPVPQPEPKPVKIRKPVLYFESDRDLTFDLDVHFTRGKLTWMYPKPNRLTDAATVQWDNIQLYADGLPRDKFAPPSLAEIAADHWANYSREGSKGSIVVNGEHERFLFYEGDGTGLPDADIFLNIDGDIVIHNHTAHALLDVRVCIERDGSTLRWLVSSVPAASGEKPGELVIGDLRGSEAALAAETQAAGLTAAQANVFERAWKEDFAATGTLSWRRTPAALDELMQLKLTLPAGMGSEVKRVGYVLVKNIDLTRQAEFEALVTKAAEGDAEAETRLKASGTAGAGALRRALASDRPLKVRLKLAKILADMK